MVSGDREGVVSFLSLPPFPVFPFSVRESQFSFSFLCECAWLFEEGGSW